MEVKHEPFQPNEIIKTEPDFVSDQLERNYLVNNFDEIKQEFELPNEHSDLLEKIEYESVCENVNNVPITIKKELDNVNEVQAADIGDIKPVVSKYVQFKDESELLTSHCSLPTLKSEATDYDYPDYYVVQPCSSKQTVLKSRSTKNTGTSVSKQKKRVYPWSVCQKSVRLSSIKKIAEDERDIEDGQRGFSIPNRQQNKSSKIQLVGCNQGGILRQIIYNFYLIEQQVPTIKKIHKKLVEEMNYTGSEKTMRQEFHKLGFRWKKTENNRKFFIEKHEIRYLRLQYLRRIKKAREENRFIVFTDETYLLTSNVSQKNRNDTSNNVLRPLSKAQRLIILGAGNENGFISGSYQRWKSISKSGDYRDDMNYNIFKKWLQEHLLCNLPENSVIVFDNAPYHNKQEDKCPTYATRKSVMQEWLRVRNIPFTDSMLKPDLYNIIKFRKPRFMKYAIDKIIRDEGHEILRLPPCHPDLNPIEMVWAALKSYVSTRNVDFTFESIENLSDEFFQSFPVEEWKKLIENVIEKERDLTAKEPLIDAAIDEIIGNLAEDSDSEDFQLDSDEDSSDDFT